MDVGRDRLVLGIAPGLTLSGWGLTVYLAVEG
jgi:hypothetical protein